MMYKTYEDYRKAQEKAVNDVPWFFAFSNEQFEEELKKRNAEIKDVVIISSMPGTFFLKKDKKAIDAYFSEDRTLALRECMEESDEFAREAFKYEMYNHEYPINYYQGDWDVLNCFSNTELDFEDYKDYKDYIREIGFKDNDKMIRIYRSCVNEVQKDFGY